MADKRKPLVDKHLGLLPNAKKDGQGITAEWQFLQSRIDGVVLKEVCNVPKENGYLTEIWRREWTLDTAPVEQVFQVLLKPGGISAWHTHMSTIDRLFCNYGCVKIVLYDARKNSPTFGKLNIFRIGAIRPTLVVIPPGIWHGVENISSDVSLLLNLVDRPYQYEDPDHWRLPAHTEEIPYRFGNGVQS